MKKGIRVFLISIVLLVTIIVIFSKWIDKDSYKYISNELEVKNLKNLNLKEYYSSEPSFHGDGVEYWVFQLTQENVKIFINQIDNNNNKWRKIEREEYLQIDFHLGLSYKPKYPMIKIIDNGYYFYNVRTISDWTPMNYTHALLNLETNMLYIYRVDM